MSIFNNTNKIRVDCSTAREASFDFKIFKDTDLTVSLINQETEQETVLTKDTDYTISISRISDGGVITLTRNHPGYDLYAIREIAYTQPEDIPTEGSFPEETIENAFDRACILSQQLKEKADRSIKLKGYLSSKETDPENGIDTELPVPSSSKLLMWDSNGKAIINSTVNASMLESMTTRLYASADNIDTVSNNLPNINSCANNTTNINKCVNNETNINKCVNNESNINNCSTNMSYIQGALTSAQTASQKATEAATSAQLAENIKNDISAFDFIDGGYAYTNPINTYDGGNANNSNTLNIIEGSNAHGLSRITFDDMESINQLPKIQKDISINETSIKTHEQLIEELQRQVLSLTERLNSLSTNIDGGSAIEV